MNANVVVVGGGPAGIITALTAKSVYPDISVCLIKEIGDGVIPCAIPYMMHNRCILQQEHQRIHPCKNPIAQHATATCCRKCIYKWHGIEKGRALNVEEVDFVEVLIMGWIAPQLDNGGHKSGHKTL